jgi:hypothetical protein
MQAARRQRRFRAALAPIDRVGRVQPVRDRQRWWSWLHLLPRLLAVLFVAAQNAWFEWANTLWLLQLQTGHVAAYGLPTYFIHEPQQYF